MKKFMKVLLVVLGLSGIFFIVSCGGSSKGSVKSTGPVMGDEPAVLLQNGTLQGLSEIKYAPTYDFVTEDRIKSTAAVGYWQFLVGTSFLGKGTCFVENGVAKITVQAPGTDPWSIQLVQIPIYMKKGTTYVASFEAKSTAKRTIMSKVSRIGGDWKAYSGERYIEIGTNMQPYSYTFTSTDNDPMARFELNFGANTNTVWVQNINLVKK